jgi:hypothetical protein
VKKQENIQGCSREFPGGSPGENKKISREVPGIKTKNLPAATGRFPCGGVMEEN